MTQEMTQVMDRVVAHVMAQVMDQVTAQVMAYAQSHGGGPCVPMVTFDDIQLLACRKYSRCEH